MTRYRGLTWDHPRGRLALERSAAGLRDASGQSLIEWDVHSLEGFESSSIAELAEKYDVIVLDHPHLGDALANDSLRSIDSLFPAEWLATLSSSSVGPSVRSYTLDGATWALPLDAATQVSARLAGLVPELPATWAEVEELSTRMPVALSLSGPHAFLTFASLCVALGEEPSTVAGTEFISRETGAAALAILARIAARAPHGSAEQNPIALLERMRTERDIAFIPLVYGYVTYSSGDAATAVTFGDAPAVFPEDATQDSSAVPGRRGSTIGGTGIAFSTRSEPSIELLDYARWLMNPITQATYIPDNSGQPSVRDAWLNPAVNKCSGNFYVDTLATIDESWVRPRFEGFTALQSILSAALREAILAMSAAGRADAATSADVLATAGAAVTAQSPSVRACIDIINEQFRTWAPSATGRVNA
jgi:multiple sugar transport system substrate-binding protein